MPDLTNLLPTLPFMALIYYLFALTGLDWLIGVCVALANKGTGWLGTQFEWSQVAAFLRTHVAFRVIPITASALLAHGIPGIVPSLDLLWIAVYASCALYLGETIQSIVKNLQAPTPPSQPAQ